MPLSNEKTFEIFGYYITDLKPNSGKKVCYICDICKSLNNKVLNSYNKDINQTLCLICSNKNNGYKKKKYSCNENYFSEKSLQSCYWAGFIAADGCIVDKTKGQKKLQIKLSNKDKVLLERFKNDIQYNGIILSNESNPQFIAGNKNITGNKKSSIIQITSDKLCDDLASIFNIHPRKSLAHEPPIGLTEEQELAYIIGYIDGDGNIGLIKRAYKYPIELNILGTEFFLNWVYLKFKNLININSNIKIRLKNKIYTIKLNCEFAYKILLYLNDNISIKKLDRKWNIVKNLNPNNFVNRSFAEINRLKTHCKYGHEFDEKNTYIYKNQRQCKKCNNERQKNINRRR